MISGFVLNGMDFDALKMLQWALSKNLRPNAVTLASVLPACAGLAALKLGKELHAKILKIGLEGRCYVGSAIIDMYAKCGRLDLACLVFSRMSERDAICWNSMITSYSQNALPKEAIDLFRQMGMEGAKYDCASISAALSACANLPALRYGKEIHGFMIRGAFSFDLFCESALIDMYAKCGQLDIARCVFERMGHKNEVSWNSIIAAYGNHGCLKDCVALFNEMREHGFQPDHVTFLALISACGHAGQVEEGKRYFNSMTQEFGIAARMEHYASMIDLFGRAGCLEEAFQVIKSMPFTPDAGIWGTLLGACRVHDNVELAELASSRLFHLDPQNSGYYVLLSNLQANAGKWEGVHKIRSMMKERGVEKIPGYSWIEVNNNTHMFVVGDTCHPQSAQIYIVLNYLLLELQKEGYVPQLGHLMYPQNFRKSFLSAVD
jgi:pentatricopeptide repeat protein